MNPVEQAGEAAWKAKLASIEALKAQRKRPTGHEERLEGEGRGVVDGGVAHGNGG